VQMPPLRDRLEDLPVLTEHLVQRLGQISGRHIRIDKEAMNCLARNPWPGNVRELSNLLERLAILYPEQTISAKDLPERYRSTGSAGWIGSGVRVQSSWGSNAEEAIEPREITASKIVEISGSEITDAEISGPEINEILEFAAPELPSGGIDLKDHLCAIEIGLIRRALVEADGTVAEAARLLRIRRTTLVEKLRKYRLSA